MFHNINIWIFFVSLQLKSEAFATHISNDDDEDSGFDFTEEEILKFHIWPLGVIPYYIDDFSFDKHLRDNIRFELDLINRATGLHFTEIPRPPDDETSRWVFFVNRKGQQDCADVAFNNFTTEGVQKVILGYDCLEGENLPGIVLALVGVPPQHNAPNRDTYIKIHQKNILPDKLYLFDILKDKEWLFHNLSYDIESAGHYHSHQYTSNGAASITVVDNEAYLNELEDSFHHKLSSIDIKKIKMLYNYISRKRHVPKYVEGCNKLFKPGSNINNFQIPQDDTKPLMKPNKYLGKISKDKEEKNKKDKITSKEKTTATENKQTTKKLDPEKTNKIKDLKGKLEEDMTDMNNSTIEDIKLDESPKHENISLLTHKSKKITLLDEEDYATSE